jgi:hypothetical protein
MNSIAEMLTFLIVGLCCGAFVGYQIGKENMLNNFKRHLSSGGNIKDAVDHESKELS